jgi:hypothetical protein
MDIDGKSEFGLRGSIANDTFPYPRGNVIVPHCELKDVREDGACL